MSFLDIIKILVIALITVITTFVIATVETGIYPMPVLEMLEFLAVGVTAILAIFGIAVIAVFFILLLFLVTYIFRPDYFPDAYKNRDCQGIYWRRLFPDVKKEDIREFLQILINIFAWRETYRCKFRPDDLVLDIFRAAEDTDGMDLYDYICTIEQDYKVDTGDLFDDDNVTLGHVFEYIVRDKSLSSSRAEGEPA